MLQPPGLQRGGEAPCGELENTTSVNFRKFPVFSSGNFAGLKCWRFSTASLKFLG
jgi:hypothetical protein